MPRSKRPTIKWTGEVTKTRRPSSASSNLHWRVTSADRGDVCIRQEDLGSEEGYDVCVFIRPEHVPALIRRLQQLVK
jgi:hypothetical protein